MLSTEVFQTRGAKVIAAVVAVLLLAAFQVALQAKPAHAWEMKVTILGAGSVVETTPAHLLNCSTSTTNPTGQVGATCFAGTPTGDYGNFWDVDYAATPASGYTFKRWESDGTTRSPIICDRSDPPATTATYSGSTTCKFRATGNLQTRVVFADETRPPTPTITSTSPSSTLVNVAKTFNFSISDPTFQRFECRVTPTVQTTFQSCNTGVSFNPPDGNYTFEVRAVDWSGNVSLTPATHSWTVDKTAPFPSITSGPSAGSFSNNSSPSFSFSSTEAATYQCRLDSAVFSSCTSSNSQSYSGLSDGSHTFYVRATDSVGNSSTNSRTWFIDTVLPETTLDPSVGPAPNSTTQDNDPVFQFSSNETNATFECNLTGPDMTSTAFIACNASPGSTSGTFTKSYTNLKDGTYTFSVRAKDQATNVDDSPETRTWTINHTPKVLANSLIPAKGATGVRRTTNVRATFSEEMASVTLRNPDNTSSTFKLQQWNEKRRVWKAVPATIVLSNSNQTATLDPYGATESTERALAARTKFKATITTGAKDAAGNPLAKNFVWTFTTGRR